MTDTLPPVILSISRLSATDEYKVVHKEKQPGGKFEVNEARSYYTSDPEDAVLTLRDEVIQSLGSGRSFKLGSKYTLMLVNRYAKSHREVRELGGGGP